MMPKFENKKGKKDVPPNRPPSFDRLHLLPPGVRSIIYDFASEALTVHVRRKWRGRETQYSSLLSLPRDKRDKFSRYTATFIGRKSLIRHISVLLTFRTALEWTQDHGVVRPGLLDTMSEIIYELTGERRTRKDVSTHVQYIEHMQQIRRPKKSQAGTRKALDNDLRATKRKVEKIRKDSSALLQLPVAMSANVESLLQSIQDIASQLPAAIQADQEISSLMDRPNPTIDGGVNIFRELSRLAADYANEFDIYLTAPVHEFYFSLFPLISVSRFYRVDALPNLASSIVYDFGNEVRMLETFSKVISPGSQCYLKHVKINMTEGFMRHNETLPFISEQNLSKHLYVTLPNIRTLTIDLWPRDPTRLDTDNRNWGEQSKTLVESLHSVRGSKVRLELRWAAYYEMFEREYVTNGAWERVLEDGPEDQSHHNGNICSRSYELRGGGVGQSSQ